MHDLDNDIQKLKKLYTEERLKKDMLEVEKEKVTAEVMKLTEEVDILDKVIILFQKSSQYAREQAKVRIEKLTSNSLQYIFQSDYKFEVELTESRKVANAEFFVVEENENGIVKTQPTISNGGGIVDIVSLALRLAFMENTNPRVDGPLILDEPAKHVSDEYSFDIGNFLVEFSKSTNRQIIMITHNLHLANLSNNVYKVEQIDGISKVERQFN